MSVFQSPSHTASTVPVLAPPARSCWSALASCCCCCLASSPTAHVLDTLATQLVFSPDGAHVAILTLRGLLTVWRLPLASFSAPASHVPSSASASAASSASSASASSSVATFFSAASLIDAWAAASRCQLVYHVLPPGGVHWPTTLSSTLDLALKRDFVITPQGSILMRQA